MRSCLKMGILLKQNSTEEGYFFTKYKKEAFYGEGYDWAKDDAKRSV